MNIEEALGRIGIGDKRARFYLAVLELGDVLTRLIRDGLVSRIEKHGQLHIAAEEPGRLLGVREDRRRLWKECCPAI